MGELKVKNTGRSALRMALAPFRSLGRTLPCVCLGILGFDAGAQDAEFTRLGDFPGGFFDSSATSVSNDGQTVAGRGSFDGGDTGFIWTAETGLQPLGELNEGAPGFFPYYGAMSANGEVVAGGRNSSDGQREAFRWSAEAGFELLGDFEGGRTSSRARGVSANGEIVVGLGYADDDELRAFRWTREAGLASLGLLPGGVSSRASGISADGRVIVGAADSGGFLKPFRWTEGAGMVGLGDPPGGFEDAGAQDVSRDGSIIVGFSQSGGSGEAFVWREGQGFATLDGIPSNATRSDANVVSDNGSVIAGSWRLPDVTGSTSEAFVWTAGTGAIRLQDALVEGGAVGLDGWVLTDIYGISGDGQWVVGHGLNPDGNYEAYRARLSSNLVARFAINPGLNDAWYNPDTSGQGFFIQVYPESGLIGVAWFTFDTEQPVNPDAANLGDIGHRWLTSLGTYGETSATLEVFNTTGGLFDSTLPKPMSDPYGTFILTFEDCRTGTIEYDLPAANVSGTVPIQRVNDENATLCEEFVSGVRE